MLKKKFIEIDYNMLVQNHVHYKICCSRKSSYGGGDAMVKDLTLQCGGEEFKSSHLQHGLP
jgi:hypothetical protein